MRQVWFSFSKTLSLWQNCLVSPPFWRCGLSPDLVTIIIICSLGNGYCMFGFLIFIIIERNFLYYSLHILTEKSLKHLCSIRVWVPMSFLFSFFLSSFLSLSLPPSGSLSLSYRQLWTARSQSIKGPQQVRPEHRHWYTWHFRQWLQRPIEVCTYWGR